MQLTKSEKSELPNETLMRSKYLLSNNEDLIQIIWLKIDNATTKKIAGILEKDIDLIRLFVVDNSYTDLSCLEID